MNSIKVKEIFLEEGSLSLAFKTLSQKYKPVMRVVFSQRYWLRANQFTPVLTTPLSVSKVRNNKLTVTERTYIAILIF